MESTVLDVGAMVIYRPGAVTLEDDSGRLLGAGGGVSGWWR